MTAVGSAIVWRGAASSRTKAASVLGSLLVVLNPVYNLLLDERLVGPSYAVGTGVNVLTWCGIALSTVASVVSSGMHLSVLRRLGLADPATTDATCAR